MGLTVYFVAQYFVLHYWRNRKHIGPLWFADVANAILWWTFVKGFWRAFSGTKLGNTLTFKTTLKGGSRFMNHNIGDLWIPALCLAGLVVSFGASLPSWPMMTRLLHLLTCTWSAQLRSYMCHKKTHTK